MGYYDNGIAAQTLIEHWNGKAWKRVPSPNPGGSSHNNVLNGVTAISAGDAWTVGNEYNGSAYQTLTEHWDGKAWKTVPSPSPAGPADFNRLSAVAAISARSVWAVGDYSSAGFLQTLVVRWNGKKWVVQPSANPGTTDNVLNGVAASSHTNAWAVGSSSDGGAGRTLALHCC